MEILVLPNIPSVVQSEIVVYSIDIAEAVGNNSFPVSQVSLSVVAITVEHEPSAATAEHP